MRSALLTGIAAITATAILGAQSPKPADQPASKIAAQWLLNRELSADPRETTGSVPPPGGPGSTGSYPTGGVSRVGGGGYGGYGGFSSGPTSERTLRDRAIIWESNRLPQVLNIVVSGATVTMTSEDGTTRKFSANGKKEKVNLTTAMVDTVTQWNQGALVQEMSSGDLKLKRSWQATEEGNRLVVTVTTERGKRSDPTTIKLVYDKPAK
jgi:hypothetical protein